MKPVMNLMTPRTAMPLHSRLALTPGACSRTFASLLGSRGSGSLQEGARMGPKAKRTPSVRTASGSGGGGTTIGGGGGGAGGGGGGGAGGAGGSESAGGLWATYLRMLETQPVFTKAWSAALLNALGDVLAQKIVDKKEHIDLHRLGIFTFLGFTIIGPPLHYWYTFLSTISLTGIPGTIVKLMLDQLLWAPVFLSGIVATQFTLEGKSNEVVPKLKQDMATILVTNWKVWIPFQFFNFNLVPVQLQVLASNVMALAWNIYMSSMSHKAVEPVAL